MFGSDKNQSSVTNQASGKKGARDAGVTILTSGCHFTGKLYCRGATRIGGTIEGQVVAEGLLVVEEEAVITGEVDAEDVVIHGRIEGKIEGRNRIEFCSTADVHAEVTTPSLVVHDGALFNGRTTMKKKVAAATDTTKGQQKSFKLMGGKKGEQGPNVPMQEGQTKPLPDIKAARIHDFDLSGTIEPAL
jgi:cytoskeletal protein CcmA (bactofilin family)